MHVLQYMASKSSHLDVDQPPTSLPFCCYIAIRRRALIIGGLIWVPDSRLVCISRSVSNLCDQFFVVTGPDAPAREREHSMSSPVIEEVAKHDISSAVSVAGHPIHAMSVHFPIAFVIATLGCDVAYWWTADPFWPRAALWAAGLAFWLGIGAGFAGTAELLLVAGIRKRAASWNHAVASVMLLSIAGMNWGLRLGDAANAVFPVGIGLSVLTSIFVGLAGYHGGKLVFHHGIGTMVSSDD
jgi:uncharacterized membrane protein